MAVLTTRLDIADLAPAFGSEVRGFDFAAPFDADTRAALRSLFDTRGLLRFRDVDPTHAQQFALSLMLIGLDDDDVRGIAPPADTFYISNRRARSAAPHGRLQFHSDTMWSDRPMQVLSLYGLAVEQPTAPTTFVSAVDAWRTLPEALRARVAGLEALHTAAPVLRGDLRDVLVSDVPDPPSAIAPLARRHERTGDTILYACEQMTKAIVGVADAASEAILGEVFAHLYRPAARWDHEWRERDLVIWDNVALQHSRRNVPIDGPTRTLRKVAWPLPPLREEQKPVINARA